VENDVYTVAERGLWRDDAFRATPAELAAMIRGAAMAAARRDGRIATASVERAHPALEPYQVVMPYFGP
jgi:hypothetical protein